MKSQTWYIPHESATHFAFPISWALAICLLNDGNSFFQCLLCVAMWGWNRYTRPPWTTGCLIPLSFLCGIIAGVLIWKGGERTKKTKEVKAAVTEILEKDRAERKKRLGFKIPKPHLPSHLPFSHHEAKTDAP
ncbi:hypothetical protein BT69DRAFT_1116974 [Atractiella rhizophila]|nr:hypothetical protein BT69DRAFT_1116974 [Atractiella rhizophila]